MDQRMYEGFCMYQFFKRLDRTHIAELSSKELTDVACKLVFLARYKTNIQGVITEHFDELDSGLLLKTSNESVLTVRLIIGINYSYATLATTFWWVSPEIGETLMSVMGRDSDLI